MKATISLYIRQPGTAEYERVERFKKNGKPELPNNYEGQFYLRYSKPGEKTKKGNSLRVQEAFDSLDAAMVKRQALTDNLDRIRTGLAPLPIVKPSLIVPAAAAGTIAAVAATYLREQEARVQDWRNGSKGGLSPDTLDVIRNAIQTFLSACAEFGAVNIAEFRDHDRGRSIMLHVKSWMAANTVRRKGKAAYTDGKKFTYISQLLAAHGIKMAQDKKVRWDGDPGLLKWHEVPRAKKPKVSDVVFYTPEDLKAMWDGAGKMAQSKNGESRSSYTPDDLRDLLCVLTLTGMRDEEIQHLQWGDIIWANGDGLPKFKVKDKPQYDWKPKNGERTVQPVEYFATALRDRLKSRKTRMKVVSDKTLVFPTTVDTPDQNFADRVRDMQNKALKSGYQFNRPEANEHNIVHNFRRTFATVLNSCYGLSAPTVQDRIGDADLETVQRYLGKVDDPVEMRKAFEALPFSSKLRK
jgi:integrase